MIVPMNLSGVVQGLGEEAVRLAPTQFRPDFGSTPSSGEERLAKKGLEELRALICWFTPPKEERRAHEQHQVAGY